MFDGEKVRQVSASRPLNNGDLLLYPNWLKSDRELRRSATNRRQQRDPAARAAAITAAAASVRNSHDLDVDEADDVSRGDGDDNPLVGVLRSPNDTGPVAASAARKQSTEQRGLILTPERVRRWVLAVHPGLLFLNKPAGVRVHGRSAGDDERGRRQWGRHVGESGGGMRPLVPVTLDDVMQKALTFGNADEPR